MSSKFFTWTKGDRRNATEALYTGGVVPIPVECISIRGLDYAHPSKNGRVVPLAIEHGPEVVSPQDQRARDSNALQDAAVKSATSLIAVVNDMLRSPNPSAQTPQFSSLTPNVGRPRSHTAPPTPMLEDAAQPLAELPGSYPSRPGPTHHLSYDGKLQAPTNIDRRGERKGMNGKRPSHPWLKLSPSSSHGAKGDQLAGCMSAPMDPALGDGHAQREQYPRQGSTYPGAPKDHSTTRADSHLQKSSSTDNIHTLPSASLPVKAGTSHLDGSLVHESPEAFLLAQVAQLRASHDAHLAAIGEAHRREISSHQSYIALLEQRRGLTRTNEVHNHPSTRIDTQASASGESRRPFTIGAPISATKPHNNALAYPRAAFRGSVQNPLTSTGTSNQCTSYGDYGQIWLECNHLRESLNQRVRQASQLEDTIHRLQASEAALRATIGDLWPRLLAAHNERMDVQEGYRKACEQARRLSEQEATLKREIEILRSQNPDSGNPATPSLRTATQTTQDRPNRWRTTSDNSHRHAKSEPLLAQIADLQKMLSKKDAQIDRLGERLRTSLNAKAAEETSLRGTEILSTPARAASAQDSSSPASPSLTRTPSPSALGISLPQTPLTVSSATAEALLTSTSSPESFAQPRTPPLGLQKRLPGTPMSPLCPPPPYTDATSPVVYLQRAATVKSVGEEILEMYADGGEGWVEWV